MPTLNDTHIDGQMLGAGSVVESGSGQLLELWQNVSHLYRGSGQIMSFEQSVISVGSGNCFEILQIVETP